ncbi:MAG: hypothetical protein P8103_16320 [Candidatus Thiodiazotropha sp.]|jgi:hypothetical protein
METVIPRWMTICFSGLLMGSVSLQAMALDPGYIEAVEADVAEFTSGEFVPPENSAWLGSASEDTSQMADLEGFSKFLQNKSPGSFIFYKKLPTEYKEQLQKDYLATGDLDRIKDDIFKYTRQLKK